jgi:hypothetical protein
MRLLKGFVLLLFVAILSISCKESKKETTKEEQTEVVKKCKKDCQKSCCIIAEKECCSTKKCEDSCVQNTASEYARKKLECKAKCEAKDNVCCKSK